MCIEHFFTEQNNFCSDEAPLPKVVLIIVIHHCKFFFSKEGLLQIPPVQKIFLNLKKRITILIIFLTLNTVFSEKE